MTVPVYRIRKRKGEVVTSPSYFNTSLMPSSFELGILLSSKVASAVIAVPSLAHTAGGKYAKQRHFPDFRSTTDFLAVGRLAEGASDDGLLLFLHLHLYPGWFKIFFISSCFAFFTNTSLRIAIRQVH